jgi:hypothetical protein
LAKNKGDGYLFSRSEINEPSPDLQLEKVRSFWQMFTEFYDKEKKKKK